MDGNTYLTGGIIEQSQTHDTEGYTASYAAVSVYGGNVVIDGTIVRNTTMGIGLFINQGYLELKNGKISAVNGTGFVVFSSPSTVLMSGGTIENDLMLYYESGGSFTMTGGTIENRVGGNAIYKDPHSTVVFSRTGGEIIGGTFGL